MPEQYLAIKKSFLGKGMGEKEAASHAARVYNHLHPEDPNPWVREKKGKRSPYLKKKEKS